MNALFLPETETLQHHFRSGSFLLRGKLVEQKAQLSSELMQGAEPMTASVLVAVAYNEVIQKLVDVGKHLLLFVRYSSESFDGQGD